MEGFEKLVQDLSDIVWGPPLLILLFGTHLFLTFRLQFIQRYIGKAIAISPSAASREGNGDVSQFGALTTALAATIGTGNIVGVATAVAAGGPGRGALDVAHRRVRHRDEVRRGAALGEVPHHDAKRRSWRADRCTCSSAG